MHKKERVIYLIENVNICKRCFEFPTILVENIWKNGEKIWHAKIYCHHVCDNKVTYADVDFDKALNNCIKDWNKIKY